MNTTDQLDLVAINAALTATQCEMNIAIHRQRNVMARVALAWVRWWSLRKGTVPRSGRPQIRVPAGGMVRKAVGAPARHTRVLVVHPGGETFAFESRDAMQRFGRTTPPWGGKWFGPGHRVVECSCEHDGVC